MNRVAATLFSAPAPPRRQHLREINPAQPLYKAAAPAFRVSPRARRGARVRHSPRAAPVRAGAGHGRALPRAVGFVVPPSLGSFQCSDGVWACRMIDSAFCTRSG